MDKLNYRPASIVGAWGIAGNLGDLAGPLANGVLVMQTYSWMGQLDPRGDAIWKKMQAKVYMIPMMISPVWILTGPVSPSLRSLQNLV